MSSDTVPENSAENTVVGALTTSDEDLNQRFTYSLADSADGRFKIEGDSVKVGQITSIITFFLVLFRINYSSRNYSKHQVYELLSKIENISLRFVP